VSFENEMLERRVGTTLRGKWTLERLLGSGGMAAVYVAHHKIGRRDAIKILHPDIAENKELAARFEQEAHAVNRFRHPGAVSILDIDVAEDGAPFLVMELLEGESLETRRLRGPIAPAEALRLADELLDVLGAAHACDIIHRDIKPDNLFVLPDGRLKVLDFGIARMRAMQPRTLHTAAGVTIGTLSYMSPEQVAGDPIDARADLFAVGCTMFEMASGRLPHEGSTEIELMVKMGMMPAPPLASVFPGAARGLCLVVDRALAFDKERRYPDAATMQADVRALRAGAPPPYASARIAVGDAPNPPESGALPAPIPPPSAPAPTQYDTAYRPATNMTATGAKSAIEVAAVAVPAASIRGGDRRDRLIAAIAIVATLALCLAVVTWRVLRSRGDDVAAETDAPASAAAPSASITPGDDEPKPTDPPLAGNDPPAQPGNIAPRSTPPQPGKAPLAPPAPQGNPGPGSPPPPAVRPPPIPVQNLLPPIPGPPGPPGPPGKGKGKGKGKKH
jgi:eukaryotic-like serine/threonine-protein kinase